MYLVRPIIVWIYHHSDCNNDVAVVVITLLLFVTLDNVSEFFQILVVGARVVVLIVVLSLTQRSLVL